MKEYLTKCSYCYHDFVYKSVSYKGFKRNVKLTLICNFCFVGSKIDVCETRRLK